MIDMTRCALPSMQTFFLDPLHEATSPYYGVNICVKLQQFLSECDHTLMENYLMQICQSLGCILKRQRGDQYGFGDDANSDLHILKNMDEKMLDDPDATNTKSIENYFGNLDREITKAGSQGFNKCSDDLIIKYAKDIIDGKHGWTTKANRKLSKKLEAKQRKFDQNQKELVASNVDEEDAAKLATSNKVIRCVSACKKSHQGPITTIEELDTLVQGWNGTEKELQRALDLEIRFRKYTFYKVKTTCPLFKQRGLTVEQKVKNLTTLITSQLEFRVLADMMDLENAINDNAVNNEAEVEEQDELMDGITQHDEQENSRGQEVTLNSIHLPLSVSG